MIVDEELKNTLERYFKWEIRDKLNMISYICIDCIFSKLEASFPTTYQKCTIHISIIHGNISCIIVDNHKPIMYVLKIVSINLIELSELESSFVNYLNPIIDNMFSEIIQKDKDEK